MNKEIKARILNFTKVFEKEGQVVVVHSSTGGMRERRMSKVDMHKVRQEMLLTLKGEKMRPCQYCKESFIEDEMIVRGHDGEHAHCEDCHHEIFTFHAA